VLVKSTNKFKISLLKLAKEDLGAVYPYKQLFDENVSSHRIDDIIYNYKIDSLEK